jgi:hypothetical protein
MPFIDLDDWKAHCQQAATGAEDAGVLSSDWAGAGITPPPARGGRIARVPLDRALALVEAAGDLEGSARREKLEEAMAWLDCPFPRTPPELTAAIRRQRTRIGEQLST